jgi:hypothetical protein
MARKKRGREGEWKAQAEQNESKLIDISFLISQNELPTKKSKERNEDEGDKMIVDDFTI